MNEEISAKEVRLLSEDGKLVGIVSIHEAVNMANEQGVDLVEISPTASPPVVKLIDFGKYRYQLQKKANEAKKKQAVVEVKEIKIRPNIEKHDLEVKLKKIGEFLEEGDKVKVLMQFRGREMAYFATGLQKFRVILESIVEIGGAIESGPDAMGNRIIAMIGPTKKAK